jgi:hypothetical protein
VANPGLGVRSWRNAILLNPISNRTKKNNSNNNSNNSSNKNMALLCYKEFLLYFFSFSGPAADYLISA